MQEEYTVAIVVPPIQMTPTAYEVQCGQTTALVVRGSGDKWRAYASPGFAVPDSEKAGYATEREALRVAEEYAEEKERGRLMRLRVNEILDGVR